MLISVHEFTKGLNAKAFDPFCMETDVHQKKKQVRQWRHKMNVISFYDALFF